MGVNGKTKGSAFERKICKRLSLWASDHAMKDVFWRSAMSGGRATVMFKSAGDVARNSCGDISAIHSCGKPLVSTFFVECKFYRDMQLNVMVYGRKGRMGSFFLEALKQSRRYGLLPMLIAKSNHTIETVAVDRQGYKLLKTCGEIELLSIFPRWGMYVFSFADLLMLDYDRLRLKYRVVS